MRKLVNAMNFERPPLNMTEDELKNADTSRDKKCIFANKTMLEKFDQLPDDVKERFQTYGQTYYSRVIDDIQGSVERAADQSLLIVKSGVSPRDLSESELEALRTTYGREWYKLANLESEQDD